ncbi:hypothetical protein F4703DRAFT_1936816 [Phycomyces blakesleeanus]
MSSQLIYKHIKHWSKDSVDGGPSSERIVVNWLSNQVNYDRWKGNDHNGATKIALCSEIRHILMANRILHRSIQDIRGRISYFHKKYIKVIN